MILWFQALIADTIGAFNSGFDTVNLHRPAMFEALACEDWSSTDRWFPRSIRPVRDRSLSLREPSVVRAWHSSGFRV
jgi:hypothetical protein